MVEEQEVDVVLMLWVLVSLMWKTVDKVVEKIDERLMWEACG